MMVIKPDIVRMAAERAAEILSGMGYQGRYGSVHLLRLNLQSNTVTAILHNLIGWQISEIDNQWTFKPKGGATSDLISSGGNEVQVKVTSNRYVKASKISPNEGYFIIVKYSRQNFHIRLDEILMGELKSDDWEGPERTQFAILKDAGEAKLQRVYP